MEALQPMTVHREQWYPAFFKHLQQLKRTISK